MADSTDYLTVAEKAARRGGDVLAEWAGRFTVSEKSPANLVTEADHASQEAIFDCIREHFPEHGFLGEEGLSRIGDDPRWRWVIDPLDGTSNYVHGFPYYAVSIALERDGELFAGTIFDPNRDEIFSAIQGGGVTLNGEQIRPSRAEKLSEALVMASLPIAAGPDDPAVQRLLRIMTHAQHVQRTGSAALNLAYVATGRIDAFWSTSLKPWDVAAGALLVTEAGGRVTCIDGSPAQIEVPDILASNGSGIHQELIELLP